MISFYQISELAQIKAIEAAIDPTVDSIYRIKCRDYSILFHTPLHVVMNELDPAFVLEQLYEHQYPPSIVQDELDSLLEKLYTIRDPDYSPMSKEEIEGLVDAVLNKELERFSKKKRPTQETIQEDIKKAEAKPKKGALNFGALEEMESKAEQNKAGFTEDQ